MARRKGYADPPGLDISRSALPNKILELIFVAADPDGSGELTTGEFLEFMRSVEKTINDRELLESRKGVAAAEAAAQAAQIAREEAREEAELDAAARRLPVIGPCRGCGMTVLCECGEAEDAEVLRLRRVLQTPQVEVFPEEWSEGPYEAYDAASAAGGAPPPALGLGLAPRRGRSDSQGSFGSLASVDSVESYDSAGSGVSRTSSRGSNARARRTARSPDTHT